MLWLALSWHGAHWVDTVHGHHLWLQFSLGIVFPQYSKIIKYLVGFTTRSQTLQPWPDRASSPAPRQLTCKYMQTDLTTHLLHLRCIILNPKWFYQYPHELTVSPPPALTRWNYLLIGILFAEALELLLILLAQMCAQSPGKAPCCLCLLCRTSLTALCDTKLLKVILCHCR